MTGPDAEHEVAFDEHRGRLARVRRDLLGRVGAVDALEGTASGPAAPAVATQISRMLCRRRSTQSQVRWPPIRRPSPIAKP